MNKKARTRGGFSLVELMVAITIFVFITTATLLNYPEFRDNLSFKTALQETSSAVRQAQVYGLGVHEYKIDQYPAYGLHFNLASPQSFVFFGDESVNQQYNSGEEVEVFTISPSNIIFELCGKSSGSSEVCGISNLNIVYLRPYPTVFLNNQAGTSYNEYVRIKLNSPKGRSGSVVVYSSGLIEIE